MKNNIEEIINEKIINTVKNCLAVRNGEIVGYEDLKNELTALLTSDVDSGQPDGKDPFEKFTGIPFVSKCKPVRKK